MDLKKIFNDRYAHASFDYMETLSMLFERIHTYSFFNKHYKISVHAEKSENQKYKFFVENKKDFRQTLKIKRILGFNSITILSPVNEPTTDDTAEVVRAIGKIKQLHRFLFEIRKMPFEVAKKQYSPEGTQLSIEHEQL
ncbi:MAG: hypothetical protein L3J35_03585 [Bacteroidales bacterium]|nr:hypothetical protein [Bacteroidales bacterium]